MYTAAAGAKRPRLADEAGAPAAGLAVSPPPAIPGEAWTLEARQPWADKAHQPAQPTPEQLEWLEAEGFLKDKEEEEGNEGEDGVPRRKDKGKKEAAIPEKSHFHGKAEVNFFE